MLVTSIKKLGLIQCEKQFQEVQFHLIDTARFQLTK